MRKLNEEKLEKLPTFNQQLNDECGRQGTPARHGITGKYCGAVGRN